MHLHLPPETSAKNGLAGSSLVSEYSGQLPGMQTPRPAWTVAVGQHVSAGLYGMPKSGHPSLMARGSRPASHGAALMSTSTAAVAAALLSALLSPVAAAETPLLFSVFLCVCPEPVLVKEDRFPIDNGGGKTFVFHTCSSSTQWHNLPLRFERVVARHPTEHWVRFPCCVCTKRHSFLSFPYVCPEPVWVKCSFLYINGAKSGVFRIVHTIAKQLLLLCLLLLLLLALMLLLLLLLLALQLLAEACVLCQCILRGLPACQKRLIPQLSLCLSRACLGKLNIENGSKRHLPYRGRLRSTRSSSCCRIRWLDSRGASDLPRSIRT